MALFSLFYNSLLSRSPRSLSSAFPHHGSRTLHVLLPRKRPHPRFLPTTTFVKPSTATFLSSSSFLSTSRFHRRFCSITDETSNDHDYSENQRNNNNKNRNDVKFLNERRRTVVTFLTDVEGDAAYLDRYVKLSRILRFVPNEPRLSPSKSSWNDGDKNTSLNPSAFPDDFYSCRYFPYDKCIDFCDDDDPTTTNNNHMLIFGGDVMDKAGNDLYVIRQLLDLKRRYPDRVVLIAGNRDINKMRISQEMGASCNNHHNVDDCSSFTNPTPPTFPKHDGVYWLRNWSRRQGKDPNEDESILPPQTNEVERLKWILARTMGSPKAFELRRLELQREKQTIRQSNNPQTLDYQHPSSSSSSSSSPSLSVAAALDDVAVSDEDVVESYRRSCHPSTGEVGNYLSNSILAYRLGELMVFHGALPLTNRVLERAIEEEQNPADFWKDLSFAKPWEEERYDDKILEQVKATNAKSTSSTAAEAIDEWINSINQFAKTSLDHWKESIRHVSSVDKQPWALEGGYPSDSPAGQLMQYGMGWTPDGKRNPTIVYQSWSIDGMPRRFYPNDDKKDMKDQMFARLVSEFFRQSKVRLLLAGHQPQGDLPLPIRINDSPTCSKGGDHNNKTLGWVLCCDTSYSGDTHWFNKQHHNDAVGRVNKGRGEGPGFRGDVAVSEVLVELNTSKRIEAVYFHGVLSDGTKYETQQLPLSSTPSSKVEVGSLAEGVMVPSKEGASQHSHWWTKADIGNAYLLASCKGYDVTNYLFRPTGV